MSDTLLAAIVGATTGVITGTIASIFAPWANWGIEKRKQKLAYRKELIVDWRKIIQNIINEHQTDRKPLIQILQMNSSWYSLKPQLPPPALRILGIKASNESGVSIAKASTRLQKIEQGHPEWELGDTMSVTILNRLIDEIGKIEKEWGLV